MTEEMRELILEEMGDTRPDCPITGEICNAECRCGECEISDEYRKWLESKKMDFFMPMIPPTSTHQERGHTVRNGKHIFYDRRNGDAEEKLLAHLAKHRPSEPFTGAIRIVVKWCFPIKGRHKEGDPHTSKPDVDNLCKALYDCMTKLGFWKDDKQIYSSVTEKFWADVPGIWVSIEEAADRC